MSIGTKKVKVGGKTYTYPRNYVTEYGERSESQKKNRETRRQARLRMEKALGKARIKGKDVDHIRGVKGGNGRGNLRVLTKKANRSRK